MNYKKRRLNKYKLNKQLKKKINKYNNLKKQLIVVFNRNKHLKWIQ